MQQFKITNAGEYRKNAKGNSSQLLTLRDSEGQSLKAWAFAQGEFSQGQQIEADLAPGRDAGSFKIKSAKLISESAQPQAPAPQAVEQTEQAPSREAKEGLEGAEAELVDSFKRIYASLDNLERAERSEVAKSLCLSLFIQQKGRR